MSSPRLEAFLARLYIDEALLADFLRRPSAVARATGLTESETMALAEIDRDGLVMAVRSLRAKRATRHRPRWRWLMAKRASRR